MSRPALDEREGVVVAREGAVVVERDPQLLDERELLEFERLELERDELEGLE